MEPLELRRARILRERIATLQTALERTGPGGGRPGDGSAALRREVLNLRTEYLRALARLADLDYRRRRETWRPSRPSPLRACS